MTSLREPNYQCSIVCAEDGRRSTVLGCTSVIFLLQITNSNTITLYRM